MKRKIFFSHDDDCSFLDCNSKGSKLMFIWSWRVLPAPKWWCPKIDKYQVWVLQTWATRHLIKSKFLYLNFCLYLYLYLYLACGVAKTEQASILCRATFSPASKIGGAHPTKDEHKRGKCENSASEKLKMRTFCFLSPGLDNF